MSRFTLGINQKRFLKSDVDLINLGSTKGRASSKRVFNHCKNTTTGENCSDTILPFKNYNQRFQRNQSINIDEPIDTIFKTDIISKNNIDNENFVVGEDIIDREFVYTSLLNDSFILRSIPQPSSIYMNPLIESNMILQNNSMPYWGDWGNDIFDGWGFVYIYDIFTGKYFFPLLKNLNGTTYGSITIQTFNFLNRKFTIKHGYPVQGIFKFDIIAHDNKPFKIGLFGNMGSDNMTSYENLQHIVQIKGVDVKLNYLYNWQNWKPEEALYVYFIPKMINDNNSNKYESLYSNDNNHLISSTVVNGLLIYLSKRYDVKDWIINDLDINI